MDVPDNWDEMKLSDRRMYLNGNMRLPDGRSLVKRNKTCAVEIWVECFGGDPRYMSRRDSAEINNILTGMSCWQKMSTPRKFNLYGSQRGFERLTTK